MVGGRKARVWEELGLNVGARCTLQGLSCGGGAGLLGGGWKVLGEEVMFLSDVEVWRRYLGVGGSKALWRGGQGCCVMRSWWSRVWERRRGCGESKHGAVSTV